MGAIVNMNRPVKVLLIEDDDDDFAIVGDMLADSSHFVIKLDRVATYEEALKVMAGNKHDVYLLDYHLGKRNGVELLRDAKEIQCTGPVIMLTGQGDRSVDLDAMKAGAVDFLPKNRVTPFSLERAIRYALERRKMEAALRQAHKLEAIGKLAGGIAHDFYNLLTVINGCTELLLAELNGAKVAESDGAKARDLVGEIQKAGARAASLTQGLLGFSRKQIVSLRLLDLNAVITNLHKMLSRQMCEDVELICDLDPTLHTVRADSSQIEQIIINLAVNGRDAMPGGGKLTLTTRNLELEENPDWAHFRVKPGPYVRLTVSDTGTGMTDEVKAHLFEPFFTTKDIGKGIGLGLATVYGIIKQNRGYITATSAAGEGSTFHVYFPSDQMPVSQSPESPSAHRELVAVSGTVLLVEDEPAVRQLFSLVLRQSGYNLLEAANGLEAVTIAEQYPGTIHLLVTDVVMPKMGGRALVDRISKLRPTMKVLYVSGYSEDDFLQRGLSTNAVGFLQKPFALDALRLKVCELLQEP